MRSRYGGVGTEADASVKKAMNEAVEMTVGLKPSSGQTQEQQFMTPSPPKKPQQEKLTPKLWQVPASIPGTPLPGQHSLLDGEYDEAANAQSFQNSLNDWRSGPTAQEEIEDSGRGLIETGANSLLDGEYNEAANAQSFQNSLNEWRTGERTVAKAAEPPIGKTRVATTSHGNTGTETMLIPAASAAEVVDRVLSSSSKGENSISYLEKVDEFYITYSFC